MSFIERCSHTQARTVFDKVTHKIEISWNQVWTGTNQERFIEVKDDQLKIKTATIISPVSGKKSIHTLAWQQVQNQITRMIMRTRPRFGWRGFLTDS